VAPAAPAPSAPLAPLGLPAPLALLLADAPSLLLEDEEDITPSLEKKHWGFIPPPSFTFRFLLGYGWGEAKAYFTLLPVVDSRGK
jgi:hypothetical protein